MRKMIKKNPDNPEQLLDLISDTFLSLLQSNRESEFTFASIKDLKKYADKKFSRDKSDKKDKSKHKRSASFNKMIYNFFKTQKRSKMILVPNKNA